ncbi:MAG: aminoglycoside phosphotransferase family protein [Bacteroidota bacterium]|nr:aminoglycoside phosphotransferase family protein [Bacteroidota bacterium]
MVSPIPNLEKIFYRFNAGGLFENGFPYGNGHINDTYKITTTNNPHDYILQRINNDIFTDIPHLQKNISRVTKHLRNKLEQIGEKDIDRKCLTLISTKTGESYLKHEDGKYWRMYIFISDHRSYDIVENAEQAREGGKAIGRFQAMLSDLPGPILNETIPFFHNIENRLNIFHDILSQDPERRAEETTAEIKFVADREEEMKTILRLGKQGKIPLRITHNDTKFNNILLDENDRALCLIDLDTVMPGYVHYDFGDAIRTAANCAAEDEENLSKVFMNMEFYKAFTEGYLREIGHVLNSTELEYLAFSPLLITYTIGLRFLTDYLNGDKYFKTQKDKHNLIRARNQFKLVESFEHNFETMKTFVSNFIG